MVLQRHVVSDHGWFVNFVWIGSYRRGWARFRGDQRLRAWIVRPQHTAIFWHFCGNFRMSCGALQKLQRRSRYEKRTKVVFCTNSKKGLENRSSRFEPKISLISFSRDSGPHLFWVTIRFHPAIVVFMGRIGIFLRTLNVAQIPVVIWPGLSRPPGQAGGGHLTGAGRIVTF